ncbi:chemotaxis response regulator protein-glutamate methylesterase of group 2 operon [Marivirga lumbricoides]|uniref:Protein-glutamate methylesterase/protein-glutamine glutaminase n=1 Tax=Marivirga lumbricoides TaxID=1046115 RepID=A0ABQ1N5Y0_9BACT|nr:chemotaxis response regulator protein-glutamate methylesterase of group 2 operon [Marivirga lumbricoides]
MRLIKVLIVDDSALVRQTFKSLLESDPEITVIATARDPFVAAEKISKVKPDVITLDLVMPKMDGLTFLQKLMKQVPIPVVVISNQTKSGADQALKALEYGAVDVISKPNISTDVLLEESRVILIDKVKSAYFAGKKTKAEDKEIHKTARTHERPSFQNYYPGKNLVIALGASTGGTEAIREFLQSLPAAMPPILIVQHMPEKFTASFAKRLNELCSLNVKEAEANEEILPNTVYVAPGNYHMSVAHLNGKNYIRVLKGELVNRHRPSVNVLFNSVATQFGRNAIGIIMTGMGDDGATGMRTMYDKGAWTIAQDKDSCVVFGMPQKAIKSKGVSEVLPLNEIAPTLLDFLNTK